MNMRAINFGIIGCGLMGREFASAAARWLHLLGQDATPRVVAVCDQSPAAMAWFTDNIPTVVCATADYRELLARPDVEAVYCAVPHSLHAELYCAIIASGKHLLGEKPFGIDAAANAQILAACAARPDVLVRGSSEFPFFPGAQRIWQLMRAGDFGQIIEASAGFLHSSDLDPTKPINWKRQAALNGAYGCMGDLGMHVVHLPLRAGWRVVNLRALLTKVVAERPGAGGALVPCDTWDNAALACLADDGGRQFPLLLETKRIAPGETNTWYLHISGTRCSARFSTREPKTLRLLEYAPGGAQFWQEHSLGYSSVYPTITGAIFEFGLSDALLQMWAAFVDELAHPGGMRGGFGCVTPAETAASHAIFTAALESWERQAVIAPA